KAVQFDHHAVAEQLHKLIRRADPAVEGGVVAVQANNLAAEVLRLHEAVLTVEDMGGVGGLASYLSLVNDRSVYDAKIIGREPNLSQFGVIDTPEFVINVLRVVNLAQVWCPTRAQAMERAEVLEAEAVKARAHVDTGYDALARAEAVSRRLG
ncbi:MAG TPA: hypothetical protein VHI14_03160, partial [Jatrophihabitantaceae bacterium]|nr:hypothetical protein [Jatrophihabitantaceae bacterium]